MIIYRIEDRAGHGPYSSAWARGFDHAFPDDGTRPPQRVPGYLSGFVSLCDLASWFSPEAQGWLARHGFRVMRYDSEHVIEREREVLFRPYGSGVRVPWPG